VTGRTAIVTGGAAGIGGGVTRRLAADGARVIANDIAAETLDALCSELGASAIPVAGDIRSPDVVRRVLDAADGRVDVLVNNVGDYRPASRDFLHSTEEQWQTLYEVNLLHVLRLTQAVLPLMVAAGRGSIVNVSTVEAFRGIPANSVYSAFNAGIVAFTRSLAVEVAQHGVRVNAIAPDLADTLQTPAALMLRGRDPALIGSWVPIGRFGQPDDYAEVVAFLASDASRFVTGVTIPVDGGTLAASGWYRRTDGKGWTNLPNDV
jgi:NAD(P)-dependent dehydrogenase (short-subunit alcohol dehydrogenase family)